MNLKKEVPDLDGGKISIEALLKEEDPIQNQIDDLVLELIRARKYVKITQMQLSDSTGIPQATISRVESFRSIPTLQILLKLSNALGLSLSFRSGGI